MKAYPGLLWSSIVLLAAGVLFYILSVAGVMWAEPTPPTDVGLYSVTVVLLGFGVGGLLLRAAKIRSHEPAY